MKANRWFVFAAVAALMGIAADVLAQPPLTYGPAISREEAKKVAAAAFAVADKNNWGVTVVVIDGGGSLIYLERADGVINASVEVAIAKARSAAAFRRSTKDFADLLAQGGLGNRFLVLPHAMPVEGGLPIIMDGKVVGAIGVSGATAQQEGVIAAAGVGAVK